MQKRIYSLERMNKDVCIPTTITVPVWLKNQIAENFWNYKEILLLGVKAKENIIVGHLHRSSFHVETDINGQTTGSWSLGCLCQKLPDYQPLVSNSQHGFAHVIVDKNGDFTVKNYMIINGKLH